MSIKKLTDFYVIIYSISKAKELMNLKENLTNSFLNGCGVAVGFVFTVVLAFGVCSVFLKHCPGVNTFLKDQYAITVSNEYLTPKDKISLSNLLERNKIVSTKDLYENILEYYNALISFLIAIIGVFGIVSLVSFQNKIKYEAEQHVENKIKHNDFNEKINLLIEKQTEKVFNDQKNDIMEDLTDAILTNIIDNEELDVRIKRIIDQSSENLNITGVENGN